MDFQLIVAAALVGVALALTFEVAMLIIALILLVYAYPMFLLYIMEKSFVEVGPQIPSILIAAVAMIAAFMITGYFYVKRQGP